MSESIFASIIEEMAERELASYADMPAFETSKKHDRAMKRIFKLYDKNTRHLRPQSEIRAMTIRRRLTVALLVIILAVITGFTAAYFISQGFHGKVYREYTELFPIDTENCPTIIEDKYYLPELPEGFEVFDTDSTPFYEYIAYENRQTCQTITFEQRVKSKFDPIHFNTEKGKLVEVEINGHAGVFIDFSNDELNSSHVIWDSGEYIIILSGDMPKNSLLNLAKSAKVLEN